MTEQALINPIGAVMVVGGGVSGQRAAYDLLEAGMQVYLVEHTPFLGGIVAQLGTMFPTHDCVLCRGTAEHGHGCSQPAISHVFLDHNKHANLTILTSTDIMSLEGDVGNFVVTVRRRPRYVDPVKCTNCGACVEFCPQEMDSEFESDLTRRKAIYKPSHRSIPNAYAIDRGPYCDDCRKCVNACIMKAINLGEEERVDRIHVGAIILATGFKLFDPRGMEELGYGIFPNVVTSMQFERYVCHSGPTYGYLERPSDGTEPKKVAWIQCVGSRDQEHEYCSSICCMYATKEAMMTKEYNRDIDTHVFMMDERTFSKEYNVYFDQAKNVYGVDYTRCRVSRVWEDPHTRDVIIRYQDEAGELHEEAFNLVVLSVGAEPPAGSEVLAQALDIGLNEYGFCRTAKFNPLETTRPGIYVCGAFSAPKEIAESVIEASGAAGVALHTLRGVQPIARERSFPPERDVEGEHPRIGVFLCNCGNSIVESVDMQELIDYAERLEDVAYAQEALFACFGGTLRRIRDAIEQYGLNRVVVAACTPRTHEALFQDVLRECGLNPYLLEMANIREQCAWVHRDDAVAATRKAKELVRIAVARVRRAEAIRKNPVLVDQHALVIGGGISGMTAALTLADEGFPVTLVERTGELGGNLRHIYFTAEGADCQAVLRDMEQRVREHANITLLMNSEVTKHGGFVGNFHATIRTLPGDATEPQLRDLRHGATIVATGGQEFRGSVYGFGQDPAILTQLELERRLVQEPDSVAKLESVVMIQCVRPQGAQWDYCSRTCCTNTMKNALRLKEINPRVRIYVLYKDLITYGFHERFYTAAREKGVVFVRYDDEANLPQVDRVGDRLQVTLRDPILDRDLVLQADVLALSMATLPAEGTEQLAQVLRVPLSPDGFFMEAHLKLRPMDFTPDGMFLCGAAHYPKFIEESISHAQSAAARAATVLRRQQLQVGGVIAVVDPEKCVGCLTCVRVCPFQVPIIDRDQPGAGEIMGAAYIAPAKCQGCGTCPSECPAKAIQLRGFRDEQIMAEGALGAWLPNVIETVS
ncbi:MAG: FAD-dependent oxidoreductase [Chloroflexi bacterium]|nr:FAD-dependent oxidoreductase [Chloroflexota bacterium]MBU1748597.1 FAD-dependent oxidoreductase [Chloroflexota bacterium]MBU1877659.1 FAD-dependent oxidoreductase [Chloroflexota bacterium]